MSIKTVAVVATAFLVFFSAYWLKNFLGLNIFGELSLSRYPVFSALDSQVINSQPFPELVIADSFDETGPLASLKREWKFHGSTVEMGPDPNNPSNRTMTIRANTSERWSGNFTRFVQVNAGEHYQYSIRVRMNGAASYARASLISYDTDRKALSWSNFTARVVGHDEWLDVRRNFTIPVGVQYIRFRITGAGIGEYRFDDFVLNKLSTSPKG
jgi:hypothetical protein